jgi:hypothetical protein
LSANAEGKMKSITPVTHQVRRPAVYRARGIRSWACDQHPCCRRPNRGRDCCLGFSPRDQPALAWPDRLPV